MRSGLVKTEKEARALIMEGRVVYKGMTLLKPGEAVSDRSGLKLTEGRRYVSRGGHKLEGLFNDLGLKASGKTVLDIGASTGGFTDYLLQNGAKFVTTVDVGYGLLSWKLRNNPKVKVLERKNFRYIEPSELGYKAEFVVVDVSFISIKKIFEKIIDISNYKAEILLLVKPQFELEKKYVRNKGIVKESIFHIEALKGIIGFLKDFKVSIEGIRFSRIKGTGGNIEFWIYLRKSINSTKSDMNYDKIIVDIVDQAHLFFNKDISYQ